MNYDESHAKWRATLAAMKFAFEDHVNMTEASWKTMPKSGIQIRIRIDPKDFQRSEPVCVRVEKPVLILDETPISEKRNQAQALFDEYCKSQGITDAHIAKTAASLRERADKRECANIIKANGLKKATWRDVRKRKTRNRRLA